MLRHRQNYLEFVEIYKYFSTRWLQGSCLALTNDSWTELDESWKKISQILTDWSLKLEANLPGRLADLHQYLEKGERLLQENLNFLGDYDELAENFQFQLEALQVIH